MMLRVLRTSTTFANVVSLLALFVALTGTAFASGLITGANVKNGSLTGKDVKDRSLAGRDIKPRSIAASALSAAARASLAGRDGVNGARGASAWDDIPSGQTVQGVFYMDTNSNTSGDFATEVNLPGRAPNALSNTTVNFAADATAATVDDDATCTGNTGAPTAPAGKVCLYYGGTTGDASTLQGQAATYDNGHHGFAVYWSDSHAQSDDAYVSGTWAYTAP